MNTPAALVGTPLRRLEDPELLQSAAPYVGDLQLPEMLCIVFVWRPLDHARVRTLSLDRVREMPGVVAAFGSYDLAVRRKPMQCMDQDGGIKERTPGVTALLACAEDGICIDCGVAVTGAEQRTVCAKTVEPAVLGKRLGRGMMAQAAEHAPERTDLLSDLHDRPEYSAFLARTYTRRALLNATPAHH